MYVDSWSRFDVIWVVLVMFLMASEASQFSSNNVSCYSRLYKTRLLESSGFFSWKFQDVESPRKTLWSWKVLEIKV